MEVNCPHCDNVFYAEDCKAKSLISRCRCCPYCGEPFTLKATKLAKIWFLILVTTTVTTVVVTPNGTIFLAFVGLAGWSFALFFLKKFYIVEKC